MVVFVLWEHDASVRFTLPALKTDITKVQRKKRRNVMLLLNSIKSTQMNTEIRHDSLVAFYWYIAEGPSCIKS